MHLFLFSGSQTDRHYRDFQALVNSAVYDGVVAKPIDIHAKRGNGPLTPKDQRDLLFVVDHFVADPYAPQAEESPYQ